MSSVLNALTSSMFGNALTSTPQNLNIPITMEIQWYQWLPVEDLVTNAHNANLDYCIRWTKERKSQQKVAIRALNLQQGQPIPLALTYVIITIGPISLQYTVDAVRERITTEAFVVTSNGTFSLGEGVVTEQVPYLYNVNQWIYSGEFNLRIVNGEFWSFGTYNKVAGICGNFNQKICDIPW